MQDAAHRAGFFGARTYRFNFRSAMQQFLLQNEGLLSLAAFPDRFIRHWSGEMEENAYIATFLAPSMAWFADYDHLKHYGRVPENSKLREDVDQRIQWEIFSEYGFSARIGRTLEKTGCSVAHLDPDFFDTTVQRLLETLQNEIGHMRHLGEATLRRFLAGLLTHLKVQGAILHPLLNGYIESWGNTYTYRITQRHIPWMPNFGRRTRAPIFLTTKSGTRFDPVISQSQGHRTWYQGWAEKCFFPIHPLVRSVTEPLYALVLKGLTEAGVMEERWIRGDRVWGIRPETLRISKDVLQFRCRGCGHNASVAASEKNYWEGSPCLRFHCSGRYEEQEQQVDYYGKMYTTGDLKRIFAAEHTGLLQRDDREDLERRFKAAEAARMPWDPNLLSCTPTLEMGIDIGDLSSIILRSMPPAQANYLQRIGRAGRRNGNALNLTVANARPHDLYFFADPAEMIAGRIEPPGVFLNASAVLERQLSAFCFDRWVESGVHQSAIPSRVGQVLNNLEPVDKQKFPHNFLEFIETRRTELFELDPNVKTKNR